MRADRSWRQQVRRLVTATAVTVSVVLVVAVGEESDAVTEMTYAVVTE